MTQPTIPDTLNEKGTHDALDKGEAPESLMTTSTNTRVSSPLSHFSAESNSDSDDAIAQQQTSDGADLEAVLTHLSISAPPDGGYGWVNVLLVFLINAHTWGLNSSFSIFLSHYTSTDTFPGATRLQYAFVGGLSIGLCYMVAPLVTLVVRRFGTGTALMIGAIFEAGGFIGASFATEIWQLFLSQGVAFGIGMGFLFVGSVGVVSQWFSTQRSLANGLATAGSGVGGLIYSLGTNAMIRNVDLAWAFRILGILAFAVNGVCAILIRDRYAIIGLPRRRLDIELFKCMEFWLLLGFGFFSMLGYIVLLFSLASDARSMGLSGTQAAIVAALMNLGQAIGRPLVGYFSDVTGRINMASTASFVGGLFALVIWTNADSYGVLIFFAVVEGLVAGTFYATISPLCAEVVDLERASSGLNIVWLFLVIPCVFSEAIGLETIQSEGGSYLGASLFTGFMYMGAALCLFLLRGWKIAETDRINSTMGTDAPAAIIDAVAEKGVEQEAKKDGWHVFLKNTLTWQKV
ncbi:hypothetical protein AAFC00_005479 [Neodothiora populina]|uniref:Major facilitator superfamily (MFS) profile domain-containing protein n=1 Tax=Neodothiora populina TaxID=2781224 RepID=A0ABR3PL10_9PEZI